MSFEEIFLFINFFTSHPEIYQQISLARSEEEVEAKIQQLGFSFTLDDLSERLQPYLHLSSEELALELKEKVANLSAQQLQCFLTYFPIE